MRSWAPWFREKAEKREKFDRSMRHITGVGEWIAARSNERGADTIGSPSNLEAPGVKSDQLAANLCIQIAAMMRLDQPEDRRGRYKMEAEAARYQGLAWGLSETALAAHVATAGAASRHFDAYLDQQKDERRRASLPWWRKLFHHPFKWCP